MQKSQFRRAVLRWHAKHGRHDLPWQQTSQPYPIWVAEIMLQQTQVRTALPYFLRFIHTFPDLQTLAAAKINEVLHLWSGLGYYARARNLHRAAAILVNERDGVFPEDPKALLQLPGIGRSSAGAIAAAAFGKRAAILDGNVKRVLCRFHAISINQAGAEKRLWRLAEELTPHKHIRDYNQAMMDLGATLCVRAKPRCESCPLRRHCRARQMKAEHRYPGAKARKPRPLRHMRALLIQNPDNEVLLVRRPERGVWGGLWSLPERRDLPLWLRNELDQNIAAASAIPPIHHDFSHFRLRIAATKITLKKNIHTLNESDDLIWLNPSRPARIGLASPIAKLLDVPSFSK